jgi:hypothetical protein
MLDLLLLTVVVVEYQQVELRNLLPVVPAELVL